MAEGTSVDNKAVVEQMVQHAANGRLDEWAALHHEDCVFVWPQSGERIEGIENATAIMRNMPGGGPKPTLVNVRGTGDLVVSESRAEYPDGTVWCWANIFEFKDGKVAHETDYFAPIFEAPEWRAQWVTKL